MKLLFAVFLLNSLPLMATSYYTCESSKINEGVKLVKTDGKEIIKTKEVTNAGNNFFKNVEICERYAYGLNKGLLAFSTEEQKEVNLECGQEPFYFNEKTMYAYSLIARTKDKKLVLLDHRLGEKQECEAVVGFLYKL